MNKNFLALTIAGTLIAAGAVAAVSDQLTTAATVVYYACKDRAGNVTTIREGSAPTCKRGQTVVSWNNEGPQGLPGTNGTNGLDGQDGQPGLGVRVWKDANGQVIGPAIVGPFPAQEAYAEYTVGSRRFQLKIPRLYEPLPGGPQAGFLPTDYGGFMWTGYFNRFANRYSQSADCSPPHYFIGISTTTQGYYSGIQYDEYAFDGPEAGRVDLLVLSDPVADSMQMQCVINYTGNAVPDNTLLYQPRTLVQTINLTELFPAPLRLE